MWIVLLIVGVFVAVIMYLMCVHSSAEGYQDEEGFHYGKEVKDDPLNKSE